MIRHTVEVGEKFWTLQAQPFASGSDLVAKLARAGRGERVARSPARQARKTCAVA
jgi:hypothetical protein